MKTTIRYIMRAAALSCLLAAAATAYGGEIRYTLRLDPSAIETDTINAPDGTPYLRLWAPDCDYVGEPGEPMIPYRCINFLVPTYSNNFRVVVDNVTTLESRTLGLPLYPIQESQSVNDFDPTLFTESIFNYEDPVEECKVISNHIVNGDSHIVKIAVPMLRIENKSNICSPYSDLSIILKYKECLPSEVNYIASSVPKSYWDVDVASKVVNPPVARESISLKDDKLGGMEYLSDKYYYVLVPETLKSSLSEFVNWKSQKGHTVIVKTVEEIVKDSRYRVVDNEIAFDKESHIRNWLKHEFAEKGTFQLLIIGDYRTSAPIRKFRDIIGSSKEWYDWYDGENFVPTDAYFSDMTSKFRIDSIADGNYYGIINQQNYSPQLLTGRLLAYEPEHLSNYIDKLLIYEINPGLGNADYLDRGFVCKQYQFRYLSSIFNSMDCFSEVNSLIDTKGGIVFAECEPTGQQVIEGMKRCGLISLMGHGSPVTICTSGDRPNDEYWEQNRYIQAISGYTPAETHHPNQEFKNGLDDLRNNGCPGILYTFSCSVTPFDNIKFPGSGYRHVPFDMGSSYTVGGAYGGVAFIGNTRTGYTGSQTAMESAFGINVSSGMNLGNAIKESSEASYNRHQQFTRNLIGDPDINLWLGTPDEPSTTVSYDNGILSITGNDVEGSHMVLYDGKTPLGEYRLPSSTTISLNKSQLNLGDTKDFAVSIFKNGQYPYIKLCYEDGCTVSSYKQYFLRGSRISNNSTASDYCFRIIHNGNFNIKSLSDLSTEAGFKVSDGGILNIESYGIVNMSGDRACEGGSIGIKAKSVLLDKGFTIEKGGVLDISTVK